MQGGQLQLNVLTPLIAHNILAAQDLMARTCDMMRTLCVDGIRVDETRMQQHLMSGLMVATALTPKLGYTQVSDLIKEADKRGVSIQTVILEKNIMGKEELDRLLDPAKLTGPNEK